mgnify:CR=1 FL=1
MQLRFAFVYICPESNPEKHRATIETPGISMTFVATKDYAEAVNICRKLVKDGVQAIELCGGFGPIGASKVIDAVGEKVPVGFVCFGCESVEKYTNILKKIREVQK